MGFLKCYVALAVCLVISTAQPVQKLPVLKDQPAEILYRAEKSTTIECLTEGGEQNVKYSWQKDGKAFSLSHDVVQRKGEGSLVFLKPTPEDEGQYQCFAETDLGTASSRVISFRRAYLTRPKVSTVEKTPVDGRPFKLECPIPDAYPKPSIVWKSLLGADPNIGENILDPRITLSPDGTLWFSNVSRDDVSTTFKYVCVANSPAVDGDVVLAEYYIKDLAEDTRPKDGELVPQYVSNDMIAKAGDVTMIYCIYGGTPLAHPDWFKDGTNVNNKPGDRVTRHNRTAGKRLLIRDTEPADQGAYLCDVNNAVGKPQKHTMFLTVVSAPAFVNKPEKKILAKENQDVIIPCKVSGTPAPQVSYTYNGKPLSNNRVSVSLEGLTIKGAQKIDQGYYGCRATNAHGDEYVESLLVVA